jgi:hypothetical protein
MLILLLACTRLGDDPVPERCAWVVISTTFEVSVYRPESKSLLTPGDLQVAYAEVANIDRLIGLSYVSAHGTN